MGLSIPSRTKRGAQNHQRLVWFQQQDVVEPVIYATGAIFYLEKTQVQSISLRGPFEG